MTKKILLVTSLMAVFVTSMILASPLANAGGHLFISESEVEVENLTTLEVEIGVTGDIPTSSAVPFGYAIVTDPPPSTSTPPLFSNNVEVIVSHGVGILDHPSQASPTDPVFHSHVLDLAFPGTLGDGCVGLGDAVVDFASSVASANNILAAHSVEVDDDEIEVEDIPASDLHDAGVEAIVAFVIVGSPGPPDASTTPLPTVPTTLPFLCVDIVGIGVGL